MRPCQSRLAGLSHLTQRAAHCEPLATTPLLQAQTARGGDLRLLSSPAESPPVVVGERDLVEQDAQLKVPLLLSDVCWSAVPP
eukprot:CAMPEP_0115131174 /NCGR_PEP_ID=MMETSP0227-20121206/52937_1 /TAXON_ID=89957 /ORGANISM="Polarella glacialis, Strain CCMP 1383" /LENGTH=82 /DNA_ID=CAMNT_0002536599 /DNA_START=6 /DNA_END=250 /DNA_ORIENTATION=-